MERVRAAQAPPLAVIAPFFIAAPLGATLCGYMLSMADGNALIVVNVPELVAATHGAVLGWLTLAMMGALYQLGPAVFGGRLVSQRLARVQFALHAGSVVWFTLAVRDWDVLRMSIGAAGLLASIVCFLINVLPAVRWPSFRSLPQAYVTVSLGFLVVTVLVGITYVGDLEHFWFPMTEGRVGGHAHLGLIGWLALTVMGLSYQLVPMFEVVKRGVARFGSAALAVTALATVIGAPVLMTDPSPLVRLAVAVGVAAGPSLWLADMVRLLRARSRRTLDIHSRATMAGLVFLALAMVTGIAAALGKPVAPGGQPARLEFAYAVFAIGGWAGTTLIANSFKIVPFLVWNARFLPRAGSERVPLLAELVDARLTHTVLVLHMAAIAVLGGGALAGSLAAVHAGAWLFVTAGLAHFAVLVSIVARHPSPAEAGRLVVSGTRAL